MDFLANLTLGFGVAVSPINLLYCFLGALIGTLIGVLPGLGPVATLSMLLPVTIFLPPTSAIIMLAGIYYGAQYGGSTTAILVNLPGESSSVVTCLDGYQMARKGRAGAALAVAALGSFFAGTIANLILALAAPPLVKVSLAFGPADYFALMTLGLVISIALGSGSLIKSLAMIVAGLLLGAIGSDIETGAHRMTFGLAALADGIAFVPLSMGLFAIPEIVANIENPEDRPVITPDYARLMPDREEIARAWPAVARGTALGSFLGVLPGGGAILASFTAYALERKVSRHPLEFGKGAIEGVAGPESANNAAAQSSFIPLLALGVPPNAVMALIAGALVIHGIRPGPQVIDAHPGLFWGLVVSMWIGNLMLVIINLPLIRVWVALLRVPYRWLYPTILALCCIGVYSVGNSTFDILLLVVFGALGYALRKWRCEPAPLLLGFILGPIMEAHFRRALQMSDGELAVFIERPISATLLAASALVLAAMAAPAIQRVRGKAFAGADT